MGFTIYIHLNNTFVCYAIDVQAVATVEDVKRRIAMKCGIDVENQRCLYHHTKLYDRSSLKELGIGEGATLTLYLHKLDGVLPFVNALINGMRIQGAPVRTPQKPLIKVFPPPDPTRLTVTAAARRDPYGNVIEPVPFLSPFPGRYIANVGDGASKGRGWRDREVAAQLAAAAAAAAAEAERQARLQGLLPGTEAFARAMQASSDEVAAAGAGIGAGAGAGAGAVTNPASPPKLSRAQRIAERMRVARIEREAAERAAEAKEAEERAARRADREARRAAGDEDVTSSSDEDAHEASIRNFYTFGRRRREGFEVSNTSKAAGGASAILGLEVQSRTGELPVGPNTITATQRLPCDKPFVMDFDLRHLRRMTDDPKSMWEVKIRLWGGPEHFPDWCIDTTVSVGWQSKKGIVITDASDDSGGLAIQRAVVDADKQRELYPELYNEPADDPKTNYPPVTKRRMGKFRTRKQRAMRLRNWRLTVTTSGMKLEYFHRQLRQWCPGARYYVRVYGVCRPEYSEITLKTGYFIFHAGRTCAVYRVLHALAYRCRDSGCRYAPCTAHHACRRCIHSRQPP